MISVDLASLEGLGALLSGVAVAFAGVYGVYQFRKSTLSRRAEWIADLYERFYLTPPLATHRKAVEDFYDARMASKVQGWLRTRPEAADLEFRAPEDAEPDLDLVLGFLEMISGLNERGQITDADVSSLFDYWLRWIASRRRPELRLYLTEFGYEGLAWLASRAAGQPTRGPLEDPLVVAVYGTLRPQDPRRSRFIEFARERGRDLGDDMLRSLGEGRLEGATLFDFEVCPGVRAGTSEVVVTLLRLGDRDVLRLMDEFEASSPFGSEAFRRAFVPVRTRDGSRGAWVYFFDGEQEGRVIESGDWLAPR